MKLDLRTEGGGRSVVQDFFSSPGFCTRLCLCTRQVFCDIIVFLFPRKSFIIGGNFVSARLHLHNFKSWKVSLKNAGWWSR